MLSVRLSSICLACFALLLGCSSDAPDAAVSQCAVACQDEVAARALRDVLKLVYNLTLQGNDVGAQDETTPCPSGGSARVSGEATSIAAQGANRLDLVYELDACAYQHPAAKAEDSYTITIDGRISEHGVLAVQPSVTTGLFFESDAISIEGNVSKPPVAYSEPRCALELVQDGNHFAGTWCGRATGFDL